MSATVVFDQNLVVRMGEATHQFKNLLDGGASVQLMNQDTGEYKKLSMVEFCSKLRTKAFVVVSNTDRGIFGPSGLPEGGIVDVNALHERDRETLAVRHGFVRFARKRGISRGQRRKLRDVVDAFIALSNAKRIARGKAPIKSFSVSTAMCWMRLFERSGKNMASLLNRNAFRKQETELHPKVEELIEWALDTIYLQRTRFSLKYTYEKLAERLAKEVKAGTLTKEQASCSYATLQRRKEELDPLMVKRRRYGTAYARSELRATIEGTQVERAMARIEVDHTVLNWVVICDRTKLPLGRPTLTIAVDSYSGYVVGLYVSFNGAGLTSVMKVIKNMIRPKSELTKYAGTEHPWIAFGVPDTLLLDNGMEFHAKHFQQAAWELAIDLEYCAVRMPWLKPKVERTFAELDYLPVGEGRVFKPVAGMLNIDPKKDAVITLSRLCRGLIIWATDIHPFQTNRLTLRRPFELFQESLAACPPPRVAVSDAALDLIAAHSEERTVAQGGVQLHNLMYAGPHLPEMIKAANGKFRALTKCDGDNLIGIYVQHPRTEEWTPLVSSCPEYTAGLTLNQHRLIRDHLRNKMKEKCTTDGLLRAKQRLIEAWMEPFANKRAMLSPEESRQYARDCASASADIERGEASLPAAATLVAREEMVVEEVEVPEIQVFFAH